MKPFASRVEMKGWRAGLIAGFGVGLSLIAIALMIGLPRSEKPWIVWVLIGILGPAGIALIVYAFHCRHRRVEWLFEATHEKIVWYRTDSSGSIYGRKEIYVSDLSAVTYSEANAEGGGGLYLDLWSGERHSISGVIPSDLDFLSWASSNYPYIKVTNLPPVFR